MSHRTHHRPNLVQMLLRKGNDIPQSGFTILAFHRESIDFTLTARNPTSRWGFAINTYSLKFFVRGQIVYRFLY